MEIINLIMSPEHPELFGALCTFLVLTFIMTLIFELDKAADPNQSPYTFGIYFWGVFICAVLSIATAFIWKLVLGIIGFFAGISLLIFVYSKINKLIAYLVMGRRDKKGDSEKNNVHP